MSGLKADVGKTNAEKTAGGPELWDLYDKYRRPAGRTHVRGEEIPEGYFYLVVHVWIKNKRGEFLISQRTESRPVFPLLWECVGGSVLRGESSIEGALREVREEIGIELLPQQGRLLFSKVRGDMDGRRFQDIADVWLFEYDGEPKLKNTDSGEVLQCQWMDAEEIRQLWDEGFFVPTLGYFFCAVHAPKEAPDYSHVLGATVSGYIDRPMGSRHPRYSDIVYPVNYGYVDGITGGDGKEQDVYLLGADGPVEAFTGRVIAVFHRYDDVEDKWIVSARGQEYSDDFILGSIYFQEQFFCGKLYR